MKIIIGLGNPGNKFEQTRHNLGFMVVDQLAQEKEAKPSWQKSKKGNLLYYWTTIENQEVELVKPQTFMNSSGKALAYLLKKHPKLNLSDLIVIHDDLDIKLGEYKIQLGKGPKQHNGIQSIETSLRGKDFWRVRIGIENREQEPADSKDYVLAKFTPQEKEVIQETIERVVKDIRELILKKE